VTGTNLRIISINTNLYYTGNYYLYQPTMELDPSGQLAWLISELAAAEAAGQRAYIIGHMPMGTGDAFHAASNYFDQIVNRFSATIAALFFGHTHNDQFQIAYNNYTQQTYQNALEVSYVCPAMVPNSGNPAFRIYSVDPVTFAILDSVTYFANTTAPGYQTTGPVWEKYYSAKEAYGPLVTPPLTDPKAELTPAFWHNVTVALQNNATAFAEYNARLTRGLNPGNYTAATQAKTICELRAAQSQYNCDVITPNVNFNKREVGSRPGEAQKVFRKVGEIKEGECEGGRMRSILSNIVGQHGLLESAFEEYKDKYKEGFEKYKQKREIGELRSRKLMFSV